MCIRPQLRSKIWFTPYYENNRLQPVVFIPHINDC